MDIENEETMTFNGSCCTFGSRWIQWFDWRFLFPHAHRKYLAGIVMTTCTDVKDVKLISVGKRKMYISEEYMGDHGRELN